VIEQGIKRFIRPDLRDLPGYQSIEPVDKLAERLGIPKDRVVKLDGNENLYGPTPRTKAAIASYDEYHIYPDPDQRRLREALSNWVKVGAEYIIAGAGSDEIIDLLFRCLTAPGERILTAVPTFGMYSFSAGVSNAGFTGVRRNDDFSLDIDAIRNEVDERTKLIVLPSPNNPTGNLITQSELHALLEIGLPLIIDEAYIEFSNVESMVSLVPEFENLIVLRTFSKWAGLAGLRVGFGVMSQALVELLMTIKPPYTPNVAAEVAAIESLADWETAITRIDAIKLERSRLFDALKKLPFLEPIESEANFILCRVLDGDARLITQRLAERGIFIRYFDNKLMRDYIRISVGLPQHTDLLLEALLEIGAVNA
jgi:histidinol-phosphate aminotransferase